MAETVIAETGFNYIPLTSRDFGSEDPIMVAQRIGQMFDLAHESAPCVLLIEECDGILSDERAATQFLVEYNKLEKQDKEGVFVGVFVLALTNNPEKLTFSFRQRSSFAFVGLPDDNARRILLVGGLLRMKQDLQMNHNLEHEEMDWLVKVTKNCSGREIESMLKEAGKLNRNKASNEQKELEDLVFTKFDVEKVLVKYPGMKEEQVQRYKEKMGTYHEYP